MICCHGFKIQESVTHATDSLRAESILSMTSLSTKSIPQKSEEGVADSGRLSASPPPRGKWKIFHVITKLELGGAQKVTLMTLERLPRDSYQLGLVTGSGGLLTDRAKGIPGLRMFRIRSLTRQIHPVRDVRAFLELYRLFRQEKPHIVHTHSSKAGILGRWAARWAGVPIIYHTAHGFGFNEDQHPLRRKFFVWLEQRTKTITTQMVVVSRANEKTAQSYRMLKEDEAILCRDAIALEEFLAPGPRGQKRSSWGVPSGKTVVGMVACFKPQKCPSDFVDLAAHVLRTRNDVHFAMVGDGELRSSVEDRIRHHGIERHISLLGWQQNMPEVYRNLDIVVLTSLWEGLPCVFSEAMASGLPIVATNVDGAAEAIEDRETGFLHETHDIEGMARSIDILLSDTGLREAMGQRGQARVPEFDINTAVSNLEASYRTFTGNLNP